jgi:pyruvate kinase
MAIDIQAKVIMVCSMSGMTARMVSRFRGPTDIIGMTTSESAWRKLSLSWGVIPALAEEFPSTEVLFYHAKNYAKKELKLNRGDAIVITGGITGKSGTTNLIKVETI